MSKTDNDAEPVKAHIKDVTGIILAGGKSSRFGSNKAFVEISGIPLIERISLLMRSIFEQVILISNTPDEYSFLNLPIHADHIPGLGPIGGIYTGLDIISNHSGFFVACDMPFINPELIRYMVDIKDEFDAVIPRVSRFVEPLHSIYGRTCLNQIKKLIESGIYQTFRSYQKLNIRYVEEEEIRAIDPELKSFLNINKPDELNNILINEK